jgi:ElaB/YqjD/DUF883 family membrane-anchored ribosome-binding protein
MSTENGRTPDAIRHDIEHTREQLAQTAAALAERTDVKARAHDKVEETKARITGKVHGAKAKVTGAPGAANPAQAAAGGVAARAKENPVPTAVLAGAAAGFLLGWLIASRRCSP